VEHLLNGVDLTKNAAGFWAVDPDFRGDVQRRLSQMEQTPQVVDVLGGWATLSATIDHTAAQMIMEANNSPELTASSNVSSKDVQ
jgi:hypothetical protein